MNREDALGCAPVGTADGTRLKCQSDEHAGELLNRDAD